MIISEGFVYDRLSSFTAQNQNPDAQNFKDDCGIGTVLARWKVTQDKEWSRRDIEYCPTMS